MRIPAILLAAAVCAAAQTNSAATAARQWRETHERAHRAGVHRPARPPQPVARHRGHPEERRRGLRAARKTRRQDAAARSLRRAARRSTARSSPRARPAPSSSTRTTTASRSTRRSGPRRRGSRSSATSRSRRTAASSRCRESGKIDPEWRLYARSASDDKAPIVAIAAALDALKAAAHPAPLQHQVRLRRRGGRRLAAPGADPRGHTDLLRGDVWLICDGPVHQSRRQQIVFGARGVVDPRYHALRTEPRAAQRPLRQLGAESRHGARPPAGDHEGRRRPRHRRPTSTTASSRSPTPRSGPSPTRPTWMPT